MAESHTDEPIIQYDEPHAAGRDRRGVLLTTNKPVIEWKKLSYSLASIHGSANPNLVRFRLPKIPRAWFHEVQANIKLAFSLSFPDKSLPTVRVVSSSHVYKYVDIETPHSNVAAESIVIAAARDRWKIGEKPLGLPQFVGLQTSELVHPIRFDKIPYDQKQDFISFLPELFHIIEPEHAIKVVDLWEMQYQVAFNSPQQTHTDWIFGSSIVVLFKFTSSLPDDGRIADVAFVDYKIAARRGERKERRLMKSNENVDKDKQERSLKG
uniref:Uncharacterized protein n=1 Tax=Melanopsichium pennsylvanicum 4 TaxID=1398559 RepID=A0A077R134_9BASI|nr:hypothetical protein BN887_05841 [Melanopsichium pennsylvanicum 4]